MANLCFFIGDFDRTGGTERVTSVIANQLADTHDVVLLSISNGLNPVFSLNDITLYSLQCESRSSNLSDIYIMRKLAEFTKLHNIDYLINVDVILGFYSIPALYFSNVKVISWEHFHYYINTGDIFQRTRRSIGKFLAKKYAYKIITLSEKDRSQYLNNGYLPDKISTIHNPFIFSDLTPSKLTEKNVLAIGRLTHQKGFDMLLNIWKKVIESHQDWKLFIVGGGNDEQKLKKMALDLEINDSVIFTGSTKNVEEFYKKSSVFVFPSRFEGFGLVLLEAKQYGLPIVSFDCDCGPSDILIDGYDGYLVKFNDLDAFSHKLKSLLDNEELRHQFGANALEDERFAIANIMKKWNKLLKS